MRLAAALFALLLCSGFAPDTDTRLERLQALHAVAEEKIATNDLRDALGIYTEIILMEPDDETAYANSGTIHLVLGEYKKAENDFLNALDINPDNETALSGLERIHDPDA